jgi:hypothetical protein
MKIHYTGFMRERIRKNPGSMAPLAVQVSRDSHSVTLDLPGFTLYGRGGNGFSNYSLTSEW